MHIYIYLFIYEAPWAGEQKLDTIQCQGDDEPVESIDSPTDLLFTMVS